MMEKMSFREMWAKYDTKQRIYWVLGVVFLIVSILLGVVSLAGFGVGKTVLLCGNLVLPDEMILYFIVSIGLGILYLWQYYKYFQIKNDLRSSMELCTDSQEEQEYERALEELGGFKTFLQKSNFSYLAFYFLAFPILFYALLLYINLPSNDEGGQVQKSVVLSIEKRRKGSDQMRFPLMMDGKVVMLSMDKLDGEIKPGTMLSVNLSSG